MNAKRHPQHLRLVSVDGNRIAEDPEKHIEEEFAQPDEKSPIRRRISKLGEAIANFTDATVNREVAATKEKLGNIEGVLRSGDESRSVFKGSDLFSMDIETDSPIFEIPFMDGKVISIDAILLGDGNAYGILGNGFKTRRSEFALDGIAIVKLPYGEHRYSSDGSLNQSPELLDYFDLNDFGITNKVWDTFDIDKAHMIDVSNDGDVTIKSMLREGSVILDVNTFERLEDANIGDAIQLRNDLEYHYNHWIPQELLN
jgi:hypothetical protein